ncbi:MAG: hypothetical protein IKK41_03240 [Oscillospiraceae bacterium]|nr:hypothetical protein [Oscillospiraceae bacterium]
MNTKRFAAFLLALCLMIGLCACGGNADNTQPSTASTAATTLPADTTEATEAATPSHTVKVVDEGGNPIAGVFVQICLDTCTPAQTDANGIASYYDMPDADYEIKLMAMPQGYGYTTEEERFFFPDGSTEAIITLQAIA